ncbi:IS3 family transposase [Streptomyces halstedii]|uniref:IS3 family transposase n=1 Tax=Streptomyces halstedii TaxID=1944 RepID=UPI002476352A|nr:IS3 family transposase [Streptomyces griseolus]
MRTRHRASDGTYGVPRITAELRETGEVVNHKRVARIMQTIGPAGLRLRRRHRTTVPDPAAAKAPDLIGCDLSTGPNQLWAADMSYVRTWTHLDAPWTHLEMALWRRRIKLDSGLIHRNDRRAQYLSIRYTAGSP